MSIHTEIPPTVRANGAGTIFQQAGWLATAKVVQGGASLAAALAMARDLGPKSFGLLSLATAIASFIATTSALGLETVAIRELSAASGAGRAILPILRRMRLLGALTGCAMLLLLAILPQLRDYGLTPLLAILCLLPFAQVGDLAEWRLIADGRSRTVAIVTLLTSPAAAILRLILALSGAGMATFAWILIAEWSGRSLLLAFSAREEHMVAPSDGRKFVTDAVALLRDAAPLLIAAIAIFAYMRIDQFMIAAMLGPEQVGLYSATVTLAEVPLVLPVLLLRAALPTLTRQSESDARMRDRTLTRLMRTGFYVHLVIAVMIALVAAPLTVTLYGEPFRAAAPVLRLQVLAAPFVALGVLSSAWLVLERRTSHSVRRTVMGAIANVALNLFLIPRFGIAGAAAATVIAQIIASYAADALYASTRDLLRLKTRAVVPLFRVSP